MPVSPESPVPPVVPGLDLESKDLGMYTQQPPRKNPIDATQPLGSPRVSTEAQTAAAAGAAAGVAPGHKPARNPRPPAPILNGFGNRGARGAGGGAVANGANGAGGGGANGGGGAGGGRVVHYSEPLRGGPLSPLSRTGVRSPSLGRGLYTFDTCIPTFVTLQGGDVVSSKPCEQQSGNGRPGQGAGCSECARVHWYPLSE